MLRRVFILFFSMITTVIMFAVFMFFFANTVQMLCRAEQDKTFTCIIEKRLLGYMPISRSTIVGVTAARTVESCDSDGCSYRVELQTASGGSEPFDDVYTDRYLVNPITERINKSIRQQDGATFREEIGVQWWVVILLSALAGISLLVETVMVFQAAYKWWMNRSQI
jgi:hypothetical protein